MDNKRRSLWQLLLLLKDPRVKIDLSCDECYDLLMYDADLLASGVEIKALEKSIQRHLTTCAKCQKDVVKRGDEALERYIKNKDRE